MSENIFEFFPNRLSLESVMIYRMYYSPRINKVFLITLKNFSVAIVDFGDRRDEIALKKTSYLLSHSTYIGTFRE